MYTDLDLEERYESAMPYTGSWSSQLGTSRPGITPPRLRAVDPADTRPGPQMTVADLRLPIEVVRARRGLRWPCPRKGHCTLDAPVAPVLRAGDRRAVSRSQPCPGVGDV